MPERTDANGRVWVMAFLDEWNALTAPPSIDWVSERFSADFRHTVQSSDPMYQLYSDLGEFTGHEGVIGVARLNTEGVRQRSEVRSLRTCAGERVLMARVRQFMWMVGSDDAGESFIDFDLVCQLDESLTMWERWSYFGDRSAADSTFADWCREVEDR